MYILTLVMFFSFNIWGSSFEEEAKTLAKAIKVSLLSELSSSIKKNGLEKSIEFCHENIDTIYRNSNKILAEKYEFGRTSLKIRNQKNYPLKWMQKYLESYQKSKSTKSSIHIFDNGKKAYFEPLFVGGLCLQCHGDTISSTLSNKIKELYPHDKAIGYKTNDFRGFIWIKEK